MRLAFLFRTASFARVILLVLSQGPRQEQEKPKDGQILVPKIERLRQ